MIELISTLRRIRACENEVAAQLVLEYFIAEKIAAERERCAKVCYETAVLQHGFHAYTALHVQEMLAAAIRALP